MVENLKMLRERLGLSQEKLAQQTGLTSRRIFSYEKEAIEPDIQTLSILADFFGVSIDFLVGRDKESQRKLYRVTLQLSKLGEQIKDARVRKGYSRKYLADMVGITSPYLAVLEKGEKAPKLDTCVKILNALDLSADEALMDSLNGAAPMKASYLNSRLSSLSLESQAFLLAVFESMINTVEKQDFIKQSNTEKELQ